MPVIDEKAANDEASRMPMFPDSRTSTVPGVDGFCRDQELIGRLERQISSKAQQKAGRRSLFELLRTNVFAFAALITAVACIPIAMFASWQNAGAWVVATFVGSLAMLSSGKSTLAYIKNKQDKAETKNKDSLFYGVSGKSLMFFLVMIPALISTCTTLATGLSLASLQSVGSFMVPLGIFLAWQELRGKRNSFLSLRRVALAGAGFYLLLLMFSTISMASQPGEAAWIATPLAGVIALIGWFAKRMSAKKCEIGIAGKVGFLAYAFACLIPSADELARDLKVMAICSDSAITRQFGFSQISAQELTQAINNLDTGGSFKSLFHFTLKPAMYQEAYYKLTGSTYRPTANLPSFEKDPFYGAPIIGALKVENVKVANADLKTTIDSKSLCAAFEWTFDFINDQGAPGQEARLQIRLPKHSAITGVQLYTVDGKSSSKSTAVFGGVLPLLKQYSEQAVQMRDPVIVHNIDDETVLLQCAPLLSTKPVRVRLNIVAPLVPSCNGKFASVNVPYVNASNVGGFSANHLHLSSDRPVATQRGENFKSGESHDVDIQKECNLQVRTTENLVDEYNVRDESGKLRHVQRTFKTFAAPVEKYVLAIDGSYANAQIKEQVTELIKQDSEHMICNVFFADATEGTLELPVNHALSRLKSMSFHGGDNNVELLSKSAECARQNHAQVLWIHSAKPWNVDKSWYNEIGYSADSKLALSDDTKNKVYSYQTTDGNNQIIEAAHVAGNNTGRFIQIANHGDLRKDLDSILTEQSELSYTFADSGKNNGRAVPGNSYLIALADAEVVNELILQGRIAEAETYASSHHQVSACTAAFCNVPLSKPVEGPQAQPANASNGTVGPQGTDAVLIMGTSGPGTIRVNNLANLEALLNIIANGMEIIGICWGLPMMIIGLVKFSSKAGPGRAMLGGCILIGGLATPGCINWLVASSRDTNVFS